MKDKEFLDGIWRKTRYLEYLKSEEEIVKQNKFKIYKEKAKIIFWLSLCAICVIVPVLLAFGTSSFSFIIIGSILLGEGTFYEYHQNISNVREVGS